MSFKMLCLGATYGMYFRRSCNSLKRMPQNHKVGLESFLEEQVKIRKKYRRFLLFYYHVTGRIMAFLKPCSSLLLSNHGQLYTGNKVDIFLINLGV